MMLVGAVISVLRKTRMVVHLHDPLPPHPSGWSDKLYRWAAHRATTWICTTPAVANSARAWLRPGAAIVEALPVADLCNCAVTRIEVADSTPRHQPGKLLVLMVARLERYKGAEDLVDASQILLRQGYMFTTVIVGGPTWGLDNGFQETLHKKVESTKSPESVILLGRVAEPTKHQLYRAADVFVLPSRRESFGLAIAEAMIHGCPVVATDNDGARRQIEEGATGIIVRPGETEALAGAIASLLDSRAYRHQMGQAARLAARALGREALAGEKRMMRAILREVQVAAPVRRTIRGRPSRPE